jgi:hypothetical protein
LLWKKTMRLPLRSWQTTLAQFGLAVVPSPPRNENRPSPRRSYRPTVESLEDRRLLAMAVNDAYYVAVNGTLSETNTSNDSYTSSWPDGYWDETGTWITGTTDPDTGEFTPFDPLCASATIISLPTSGSLHDYDYDGDGIPDPGSGFRFTYTPAAGFVGTDSFGYSLVDNESTSAAWVTITVENPPVANFETFTTLVDAPLSIDARGVLANDTDADGDPLTAALITPPNHGSLTLNSDGSFDYTPDTNYDGLDSFTYQAFDGYLYSQSTVAWIRVVSSPLKKPRG